MTRVLLLGYDPETVDFSNPALPPRMSLEKVHADIAVALKQFAERGWGSRRTPAPLPHNRSSSKLTDAPLSARRFRQAGLNQRRSHRIIRNHQCCS